MPEPLLPDFVTGFSAQGGNVQITLTPIPLEVYQLQSSGSLTSPLWANAGSPVSVSTSLYPITLSDSGSPGFYRLSISLRPEQKGSTASKSTPENISGSR